MNEIFNYGVVSGEAHILSLTLGTLIAAVPGSVTATDEAGDGGLYNKQIAFRLGHVSADRTRLLRSFTRERLVVVYVDDEGAVRVAGSLDCPMFLTFDISGGLYECNLSGSCPEPSPYLADS